MIAFVHVAKAAGSTVNGLLECAHGRRHLASVDVPGRSGDESVLIPKYRPQDAADVLALAKGTRSIGGHHIALWSDLEEVVSDVVYLVILRDPIRRAASHYLYHRRQRDMTRHVGKPVMSWAEWCEWDIHHDHQVKMLSPNVDPAEAIDLLESKNVFVGLSGKLDESLVLFKALFAPDLDIAYRRRNTAPDNRPARELLADSRKVEQIREMYAKEFPVYEYVTQEIYPRYVREYGDRLASDVAAYQAGPRDRINRWNRMMYRLHRRFVFAPRYRRWCARNSR